MKKVRSNQKINLDKTFLPKRKRVRNKRALSVRNKPAKKTKVVTEDLCDSQSAISACFVKKPFEDVTQDLLDSQCSISACFLDSQARRSPATPTFEV